MILDFFPKSFDMNIDSSGIAHIFISPNLVKELLPCKNTVGRSRKKIKKLKLLGGHFNSSAIIDNRVVCEINGETGIGHLLGI